MSSIDIPEFVLKGSLFASVSGGKDSTAMCLHMRELGLPYRAVFADTGWEHADTYRHLREVLEDTIGPIAWVRAEVPLEGDRLAMAEELEEMLGHYSAMVRWVLKKAVMPARMLRWCTPETKVHPIDAFMSSATTGEIVSAQGIRAGESRARAKLTEWEFAEDRDLWTWRPLIAWSEADVIATHHRHGLMPNPLYLRGAERVGCWPCIFARKSEIKLIADTDPVRIDVIRKLEAYTAQLSRERIHSRGDIQTGHDPSWFQAAYRFESADGRTGYHYPIDEVVLWSRTARGGRQFELFAPLTEPGCVRWGLCEAQITPPADEQR